MFDTSGKIEFDKKDQYDEFLSGGKGTRKKIGRTLPKSEDGDKGSDSLAPKSFLNNKGNSFNPNPVREEKVKEAKRKKQRGDYNNQEVYQKIADRLMDLFGVK